MSKFFRDISYVSLGILIGGIFLFIYYIILARILSPEQFGIFNVFLSLIYILSRLSFYGIKIATARLIAIEDREEIIASSLYANLSIGAFLILLIFAFKKQVCSLIGGNIWVPFMVSIFLFSFMFFVEGILQGKMKMKLIFIQKFLIDFIRILILIPIVLLKLNFYFIVLSVPISLLIYDILISFFVAEDIKIEKFNPPLIREIIFTGLSVSIIQACINFVYYGGNILIKIIESSEMVGKFAIAVILLRTPTLLYEGLLISILPRISKGNNINEYIKKSLYITFIYSFLIIIFSCTLVKGFVKIVYGEKYVMESLHYILISLIIVVNLFALLLNETLIGMGIANRCMLAWILPFPVFIAPLLIPSILMVEIALILYNLLVVIILGIISRTTLVVKK